MMLFICCGFFSFSIKKFSHYFDELTNGKKTSWGHFWRAKFDTFSFLGAQPRRLRTISGKFYWDDSRGGDPNERSLTPFMQFRNTFGFVAGRGGKEGKYWTSGPDLIVIRYDFEFAQKIKMVSLNAPKINREPTFIFISLSASSLTLYYSSIALFQLRNQIPFCNPFYTPSNGSDAVHQHSRVVSHFHMWLASTSSRTLVSCREKTTRKKSENRQKRKLKKRVWDVRHMWCVKMIRWIVM